MMMMMAILHCSIDVDGEGNDNPIGATDDLL